MKPKKKTCSVCEKEKPLSEFYTRPCGRKRAACKDCHRIRVAKYPKPKRTCETCGKKKCYASFFWDSNECKSCLAAYEYFNNVYWRLARRRSRAFRRGESAGVQIGDLFIPHASSVNRVYHRALNEHGKPFKCTHVYDTIVCSGDDQFARTEWHFEIC